MLLPPFIGHRGIKGYAPENTLAGLKKAYELGFQWVEFDVTLAKCSTSILVHDEFLERTTTGKGRVCDFPYTELETLDAGGFFSQDYRGEKIPTFSEYIKKLAEYGMSANVEIKPSTGLEEETAAQVVRIIQQQWPKTLPPPLVSSFSWAALKVARSLDPNLMLGYLMDNRQLFWQQRVKELNCVSVHFNYRIATKKFVQKIKALGCFALAYTVNDLAVAERLFAWGVDSIFTDNLLPQQQQVYSS